MVGVGLMQSAEGLKKETGFPEEKEAPLWTTVPILAIPVDGFQPHQPHSYGSQSLALYLLVSLYLRTQTRGSF